MWLGEFDSLSKFGPICFLKGNSSLEALVERQWAVNWSRHTAQNRPAIPLGGGGEVEDVMEPYTTAAIRLCQQTESIKYPEIINGSVVSTSMAGSRRLLPRSMFLSDVLQRGHERKRSTCAARTHLVIDDDSAEKIARRQRGDGFAQTEAKNNVLASDGLFEISHAHHLWSLGTYRRRYSMNRS